MVVAPIIGLAVSAAGTVAGISAQRSAANRQSQALADQRLLAEDALIFRKRQIEESKLANERRFERERAVLDAETRQARVNLDIQKEQTSLQDLQRTLEIQTVGAQADQQASQLTAVAAAGETEAAVANTQQLFQLAQRFLGSDEAASNFITQFAAATGSPQLTRTAEALLTNQQLEDIGEGQAVRQDVTTRSRIATTQGDLQRRQADIVQQQGVLSTDYLSSVQDLQNRANDIAFKQSEFDIDNVSQQNLAGLEAANLAAQAELQVNRGVAEQEFRSQSAALDAQQGSIQRPNTFGSLANLGAQAFGVFSQPSLLGAQQTSLFGSTQGTSFSSPSVPQVNSSNLSFGTQFRTGL